MSNSGGGDAQWNSLFREPVREIGLSVKGNTFSNNYIRNDLYKDAGSFARLLVKGTD